jgi:hypothetical protein
MQAVDKEKAIPMASRKRYGSDNAVRLLAVGGLLHQEPKRGRAPPTAPSRASVQTWALQG